jgi:hypothetical protein
MIAATPAIHPPLGRRAGVALNAGDHRTARDHGSAAQPANRNHYQRAPLSRPGAKLQLRAHNITIKNNFYTLLIYNKSSE